MYDGLYKAFVCNLTRWVWKRIQAHRVRWMHSTPEGLALEEAAQRLKPILDSSYAADDSRIYPLGKLRETLGCSAAIMELLPSYEEDECTVDEEEDEYGVQYEVPTHQGKYARKLRTRPADGAEEGR
jgi:hypothetical protein